MNDERELKLGNIRDLDVDADPATTAEPRRHSASGSASGSARAGEATGKSAASGTATKKSVATDGSSIWMAATGFLMVLVLVLGTWFFRQLSSLQAVVDNRLEQSTEQLGSLASQLSATDESVTQSSGQVRETLATHDSEIRKLWDVANKRNRDWIQKNQADIAQLNRQRGELNKAIESLKAELATLKKSTDQMTVAKNQLQTQIGVQAETVKQLETRAATQQKQVEALNKLLPAMQSLARVDGAGGGLANRLTEIESAINAIDAHRRQVNVRLDRLDGGAP
jgi:septal ring factor EnvC (AmiA/AmiB activator)